MTTFKDCPPILTVSVVLATVGLLALTWIGYRGYADDILTIRGAQMWLDSFPYLGQTHWELRHPYVWGVASGIGVLGISEFSVIAVNYAAMLVVVWLLWSALCRWLGSIGAVVGAVLLLSTPAFVFAGSTVTPGIVELMFVLISVLSYLRAAELAGRDQSRWLFMSGIALGLAFLVRETTLGLVAAFGVLFLLGNGIARPRYLAIAAGFTIVVALEVSAIWLATGDPFYRYKIDMEQHHPWAEMRAYDFVSGSSSAEDVAAEMPEVKEVEGVARATALPLRDGTMLPAREASPEHIPMTHAKTVAGGTPTHGVAPTNTKTILDRIFRGPSHGTHVGPIDVGPQLNPYIALITNHEYGLLFVWFGLAGAVLLLAPRRRRAVPSQVWVILLLGITWFLVQVYVAGVRAHPRYFLPLIVAAVLVVAALLSLEWQSGRRWIVATVLAFSVAVGALAYDLQSETARTQRIYANALAEFAEPIAAASDVVSGAKFLTQTRGVEELASSELPERGGLLFVVDGKTVDENLLHSVGQTTLVKEWVPRRRLAGIILKLLGILSHLPAGLQDKLYLPDPTLAVYRKL